MVSTEGAVMRAICGLASHGPQTPGTPAALSRRRGIRPEGLLRGDELGTNLFVCLISRGRF